MALLVKTTSRMLVALLLCAMIAMFIPSPARAAAKPATHSCCAQMPKASHDQPECPMHQHSPTRQQQDSSCCQLCAAGIALLYSSPADFVYTQTGEESLVSLNASSHTLPHRPPVPPPRIAFA